MELVWIGTRLCWMRNYPSRDRSTKFIQDQMHLPSSFIYFVALLVQHMSLFIQLAFYNFEEVYQALMGLRRALW